jgi:hypothetical protein
MGLRLSEYGLFFVTDLAYRWNRDVRSIYEIACMVSSVE